MLPSGVIARPCGVWPTSMLLVTLSLLVSMTLTVEAPSLLTYTQRPSGVTTMPCGPVGNGIVERIWLDPVSNTATALTLNNPTYALGAGADCAAATGLYARAYALLPASSKAVMVARRHPRAKRECSMSVNAPCWRKKLDEEKSDPSRAGTHLSITDEYPAGVDVDCDSVLARRNESWRSRRSVGDPTPAEHAAADHNRPRQTLLHGEIVQDFATILERHL